MDSYFVKHMLRAVCWLMDVLMIVTHDLLDHAGAAIPLGSAWGMLSKGRIICIHGD